MKFNMVKYHKQYKLMLLVMFIQKHVHEFSNSLYLYIQDVGLGVRGMVL